MAVTKQLLSTNFFKYFCMVIATTFHIWVGLKDESLIRIDAKKNNHNARQEGNADLLK